MVNEEKCRQGANRGISPWKDDPLNYSYHTYSCNNWTSCWITTKKALCLYYVLKFPRSGRVFGRSSNYFRSIIYYQSYAYQYLLALVALISLWDQNFRRTAGLTFSAFHDWSIEQSDSVLTFLGQMQSDHCRRTLHLRRIENRLFIRIQKALWRKLEPLFSRNKKLYATKTWGKKNALASEGKSCRPETKNSRSISV